MDLPTNARARLLAVVKASRIFGWIFGPVLFSIGIIHSRIQPKSILSSPLPSLQIFALTFPLCSSTNLPDAL
jgi:hypothetical protein